MDPDTFQKRDLKRRISKLEDQIGYLKTDLKRQTQRVNALLMDQAKVLPILIKLQEAAGGPPEGRT